VIPRVRPTHFAQQYAHFRASNPCNRCPVRREPAISSQYRRDRRLSRFARAAPLPDCAAGKRSSRMRRKDWMGGTRPAVTMWMDHSRSLLV
jgi:hypothetical protein